SQALDQALENLRQNLRAGDHQDLPQALAKLDQALVAFESGREKGTRELRHTLEALLETLQRRADSGAQKKSLRRLSQDISRERELLHACPVLLQRLAELQRSIILGESAPEPGKGLLSRFLGKSEKPPIAEENGAEPVKSDRALFELNPNASLRDSETVSLQLRSIINELLASVEAQSLAPQQVQQLQQRLQARAAE